MSTPQLSSGRPPRVHLIDDDAELLSALKFALELDGFEIITHSKPLAFLSEGSKLAGDCLVVDQIMDGVNGLELLDGLRQLGVIVPAILITTNPGAVLRERAARAGVPIVEKPLLGSKLSDAIRAALATH